MVIKFYNKFLKFFAGVLSMLILASCLSDDIFTPDIEKMDGESVVTFSIQVPGTSTPSALRAISLSDENEVKEIDIVVFEPGGGEYVYRTGCSGSAISGSGTNSRLKTFAVNMRQGEFDVVILANARSIIGDISLDGLTKAVALAQMEARMPESGKWPTSPFSPFPMWGDIGDVDIDDTTDFTGDNKVILTRMVARVDVQIAAENFMLTSVDVYNYNTAGTLVPKAADWDTTTDPDAPRVIAPNIPSSSTLTKGPVIYQDDYIDTGNNQCIREIYVFEAENHSDAGHTKGKGLLDRTCLVIGGIWDANGDSDLTNDGPPTYYRVDFSHGNGVSQQYLDVLRNHRYIFSINKVSGPGYEDSNTAFISGPVNIEAEVLEWNEVNMGNIAFDGQFVLSVSQNEFTFFQNACSEKEDDNVLYVFTDYETDGQSGWYIEKIESATTGVGTDWLTLTPNVGTANNKTEVILTYEANNTGGDRTVTVWFAAGRLRYPVTVTQGIMPRISLNIVDPVTMQPLRELIFDAAVGQIPDAQSFMVNWEPKLADVTVLNVTVAANPFPSGSGAPSSGPIAGGAGTVTYNIQPPAITGNEVIEFPFLDKTSKVDFTVTNGISYASQSILLRQINYNFIAKPEVFYRLDGSTHSLQVRCNTSWRIKEINEYPSSEGKTFFNLMSSDNLRVGATGGYNVSGEPVTFTVVDDRTFGGHVDVVFENTENKFDEHTVRLQFTLPKMKIMGLANHIHYGYNVAVFANNNDAYTFLSSPSNFGLTSGSTIPSMGFEFRGPLATGVIGNSTLQGYLDEKPDIIVLGYDLYINAAQGQMFAEYLKKGGVLIALNEGNGLSVQNLMRAVFEDNTINQLVRNAAGAVYKLPNIDDPVLNGPFGDLRGLQWGEDASGTMTASNIPLDEVIVYSNASDVSGGTSFTELTAFRHKELGFVWFGDGGFVSSDDPTSPTICPFMLDAEKRPVYKSNYGLSAINRYNVYNSQLFANMIYWGILYSLENNRQSGNN